MRMHRGSSKDARESARTPGILPLSASPPSSVTVVLEVTRAGNVERRRVKVARGTSVRAVLRSIGQAAEGSAVLLDETSIPLDLPIERPLRLTVVSTFSGG
jgi:sulfur carrier protein ThiS